MKEIVQENHSEPKYCFQFQQTILMTSKINGEKIPIKAHSKEILEHW